jgi:hypothetical protein
MRKLLLITAFLIGGFTAYAQWAEDFDGKTSLDLQAECWNLNNTTAFTRNGLSCGLTASTSVIAAENDAISVPDSLTLTTPPFADSGTVFFDYTINQRTTKNRLFVRKINRAGQVVSTDTLIPDTVVNVMTVNIGPLEKIELTFEWLSSSTLSDTIFVDDFISTVDVQYCGVFAIEEPEPDVPAALPVFPEDKPSRTQMFSIWGEILNHRPENQLFILKNIYDYKNYFSYEYKKLYVIR